MKKSDLRTGMLAENKHGKKFVVMVTEDHGKYLMQYDKEQYDINDIREDLMYPKGHVYFNLSIDKVWGESKLKHKSLTAEIGTRELLWERKPTVTVTVEGGKTVELSQESAKALNLI